MSILLLSVLAGVAAAQPAPADDWPPELAPLLAAYRAERFDDVRDACRSLMAAAPREDIRREAAALLALTLLRSEARSDRLDGRSRLLQLAQRDAALLERPECQLALGEAAVALAETSTALRALSGAADGFAARGQPERQAAALAALAGAWTRHSEWETTPRELKVPIPESPIAAAFVRRSKIQAIRAAVEQLGDPQPPGPGTTIPVAESPPWLNDALLRIDRALAEALMARDETAAEAIKLLDRLAATDPKTHAGVDAAFLAASLLESRGDATRAIEIYRRIAAGPFEAPAAAARERIDALLSPALELILPRQVRVGAQAPIALRARNIDAASIEVRRLDLPAWLQSQNGRIVDAQLPTAGAVVLTRELAVHAAQPHNWTTPDDAPLPTLPAEPGVYVVVARGRGSDGQPAEQRRLVLVSDLEATAIIGRTRGTIRTQMSGATDPASAGEATTARFWMVGGFAPTNVTFDGSIGTFALPGAARVLRDRRWVVLVQRGPHAALCAGEISAAAREPLALPSVALAGASRAIAGQPLPLAGVLIPRLGRHGDPPPRPVTLELLDAADRPAAVVEAAVDECGVLSAELPIPLELAGQHARVIVRHERRLIENVRGRFPVEIAALDESGARLVCRAPSRLARAAAPLTYEIQATWPWGAPLIGADVFCILRAVRLADGDAPEAHGAFPLKRRGKLDESGRFRFVLVPGEFQLPDGPMAIGLWAEVISQDGRRVADSHETLIAPQAAWLWITPRPEMPQVGRPVRFSIGWFDPAGRSTGFEPRVQVLQSGKPVSAPRVIPTPAGPMAEPWVPQSAGEFTIRAELSGDDAPLVAERTLTVAEPSRDHGRDEPAAALTARFAEHDGRRGVDVSVVGTHRTPLTILVENGDPLAVTELAADAAGTFIAVPGDPPRVRVRAIGARGIDEADSVLVEDDRTVELALRPRAGEPVSGLPAEFDLIAASTGGSPADGSVIVRLIPEGQTGYLPWLPGEVRAFANPGGDALSIGFAVAANSPDTSTPDVAGDQRPQGPATPDAPPDTMLRGLFEGQTLWAGYAPLRGGRGTITVPIPSQPGRYRLLAMLVGPGGADAVAAHVIDTRGGILATASFPRRLSVGDRVTAAVVLDSGSATTLDVRVALDGGPGLSVEQLTVASGGEPASRSMGETGDVTFPLAAGRSACIQARIEAARGGAFEAVVRYSAGDRTRDLRIPFEIVEPAAGAAGGPPAIRITRSIARLTPVDPPDARLADAAGPIRPSRVEWSRMPLQPGDRVQSGDLLLVSEQIEVSGLLEAVEWVQPLPATTCSFKGSHVEQRLPADVRVDQRDRIRFAFAELRPALQTYEYVIVAERPGACAFRAPQVRANGQPVNVAVGPAEWMIVVGGPAVSGR